MPVIIFFFNNECFYLYQFSRSGDILEIDMCNVLKSLINKVEKFVKKEKLLA